MRSCDTCPGGTDCAAVNLRPVLRQVLGLYAAGLTDKFEILFSLGEGNEALLEKNDPQVSDACWTKASLLAIADTLAGWETSAWRKDAPVLIAYALNAFEPFPWQVPELIEQAPDLYQAIIEKAPDSPFASDISKRTFVKICQNVAFQK